MRVGPEEVSYANVGVVKEIYGQQTEYLKAPVYDDFSTAPVGIFSMRNKAEHSQRRRLLSHAFSQSNLTNTEPLIKQQIEKLVASVDGSVGKPLDMLALFRMVAFDIIGTWLILRTISILSADAHYTIGELFLGQSFGGLDSTRTPPFLVDMDHAFMVAGVQANFPVMYHVLRRLPIPSIKHFLESRDRLREV